MSTLSVPYWARQPSDWLGFRMFPRVPCVFKAWNVVGVPPRAQCFPSSEAFFALMC